MRTDWFEKTRQGCVALGLLAVGAGLVLALSAQLAYAGQTHLLEGEFSPPLSSAISIAVDQSTGDVIVLEAGAQQISRYHSNGSPSNFSTLGTNVIDAKGAGDETPENGFSFEPSFGSLYSQVAVDNSGTATDGNIYVTQNLFAGLRLIDIFDSSGKYLGQITGAGTGLGAIAFGSGPDSEGVLSPCGVAIDPDGNLFAAGWRENKIYRYDSAGNPPTNADHVATIPLEQPCQIASGAGPSEDSLFVTEYGGRVSKLKSSSGAFECQVEGGQNNQLSVNPDDGHIFVAGNGSITEYDASECPAVLVSSFGGAGTGVAADGLDGRVYVSRGGHLDVYGPLVPLPDPTTEPASGIGKTSVTLNGTVETNGEELTECFFEYGTTIAYDQTAACAESSAEIGTGFKAVHADVGGLAGETVYHFRLIAGNVNGRGEPGEDASFQTVSKPEILGSWAEEVIFSEAKLRAKVNPQSAETACRFEWGTSSSYGNSTPEATIGSEPVPRIVGFSLQKLVAGTTYHFHALCENEMGTSEGPDRAFVTLRPSPPTAYSCANKALRTGASPSLPDCRAYEMVSPVDKNGGDIVRELGGAGETGGYVQSTPDGNSLAYTTLSAFADPSAAVNFNQYITIRKERGEPDEGWSSGGVHIPVVGQSINGVVDGEFGIVREFMAFSPDLCSGWLIDTQTPPVISEGQGGFPNLYRRDNCGNDAGSFEALIPSPPYELQPGTGKIFVERKSIQGYSSDSHHAIFTAKTKLNNEAAPGFNAQLYDRFCPIADSEICHGTEGSLTLVSVLPNGSPASGSSEAGGGALRNLDNAVSEDGSHVYWSSGQLYLRLHPEQGIVSNECEGGAACTITVSSGSAIFWTASADGSRALYSEGDELYEFDLEREQGGGEASRLIATGVKGVAGASEDLSRIYFVSTNELPEAGQNSEEEEAVAAQPNLYLEADGASKEDPLSFIGTLVAGDVGQKESGANVLAYDLTEQNPYQRATRVSADGEHLAFQSRAPLTGYDNTAEDGRAAVEVFAYEAGGGLLCISCNPSGARPSGVKELRQPYAPPWSGIPTKVQAAAWIPSWEQRLNPSNVISSDGTRLFFNSFDPLVPSDANGAQDVYEWEAPGTGSCPEGSASYFAENGGCIYLISSGHSPYESEFWEASPDGENVFFTTEESLLKRDPGSIDLYDARVDGGFPEPEVKVECEGEACQSAPPPPEFPDGSSATFSGPGNPSKPKPGCPKGKHKVRKGGKVKCVKKKAKHGKGKRNQRANANRRAGR